MKMPQRRLKRTRSPGRQPGGGGQAKILSATELNRVDKCLAGIPNELRNRALVFLQYATGMRVGELASLDVRQAGGDGV
jgi:site-specific recombinase XerD